MFEVQFYSNFAKKYVTISEHKKLAKAVLRARKAYSEEGYHDVSILMDKEVRLDRYGMSECQYCRPGECSGTDCHIKD